MFIKMSTFKKEKENYINKKDKAVNRLAKCQKTSANKPTVNNRNYFVINISVILKFGLNQYCMAQG